ncbi:MAG: hypothetical protein GX843_06420 [Synergistaceae bacterium]|jgi:hypothetical protein|nr:hypothetical protein [Synergistaceae bacterium]
MKRIMLIICAALLSCSLFFAGTANADSDYVGYYAPFGYSENEDADFSESYNGFPVYITLHLELNHDGTYEAVILGALTSGQWEKVETEKGNEYVLMSLEETVDEELKEMYKDYDIDDGVFGLIPLGNNRFLFAGEESDEEFYLEKQQGKMDTDAVIDKIGRYIDGTDDDFVGYYAPFGYTEDDDADVSEFWEEYPVYVTVHLELNHDGTYEAIYFGRLTTGKWEKRKTEEGDEYTVLTLEESNSKALKERYGDYGKDEAVFLLYPFDDNRLLISEMEGDEQYYLEKQQGKMDTDAVLDKISEYVN